MRLLSRRRRESSRAPVVERISMYAAEFSLHAKPGHCAEVAALYSALPLTSCRIIPRSKAS